MLHFYKLLIIYSHNNMTLQKKHNNFSSQYFFSEIIITLGVKNSDDFIQSFSLNHSGSLVKRLERRKETF